MLILPSLPGLTRYLKIQIPENTMTCMVMMRMTRAHRHNTIATHIIGTSLAYTMMILLLWPWLRQIMVWFSVLIDNFHSVFCNIFLFIVFYEWKTNNYCLKNIKKPFAMLGDNLYFWANSEFLKIWLIDIDKNNFDINILIQFLMQNSPSLNILLLLYEICILYY